MDSILPSQAELRFQVGSTLTSSHTACLLEAGLTFILYQRGQIPLPYKQLETSFQTFLRNGNKDANSPLSSLPMSSTSFENPMSCSSKSQVDDEEGSLNLNPRQRISIMVDERRKRRLAQRLEKQRRMALVNESKVYNAIQPALEMLERVLLEEASSRRELRLGPAGCNSSRVMSIALILGPSIYSPKEVYYFELPTVLSNESTLSSIASDDQFQKSVLRQFYKKIITDSEFMDFTSKQLGKTYSHICIISVGDLNSILSDNYFKDIVRLPSVPPSLLQIVSASAGESGIEPDIQVYSQRQRNKCFKIKIRSTFAQEESLERISYDSSSFSSDILFNSNSFFCYQIPLRFKGVQCKNKRL